MTTISFPYKIPLFTDVAVLKKWAHNFSMEMMRSGCDAEYSNRGQKDPKKKYAQNLYSKYSERVAREWLNSEGFPYQLDERILNPALKNWDADLQGPGLLKLSHKNDHQTVSRTSWIVNKWSSRGGGLDKKFFRHHFLGTQVNWKSGEVTLLVITSPDVLINAIGITEYAGLREFKDAIYLDPAPEFRSRGMDRSKFIYDLDQLRTG